ncbi:MAG: hypothetical protein PHD65_05975 [Gallionella sp.]|nr:hypothetical protein [Gallionella sp.]
MTSLHTDLVKTPTSACRIPIFAPTRRPLAKTAWWVDTSWGHAVITGRLGQQHRDLLDAARMVAEREDWTTDGRLHLLVDPAKLRAAMGGDAVNWPLLKTWLTDLAQAIVDYHVNKPDINGYGDGFGGLLSDVRVANTTQLPITRPGAWMGGRQFMRISFGVGWSRLIADDNATRYPVRQVVALKHGFSQAVARYCLSHATVRDTVAGLMLKLDAQGELRKRRRELAADTAELAALGIIIEGDKISTERKQSPGDRKQSPGDRKQSPGETPPLSIDQ